MVPFQKLNAFLLVVCAVCLSVTGELFLKSGMNRVGPVGFKAILSALVRIAGTPQIWVGFLFLSGGAALWLAALSRAPLSWAYPILSLGYILILLFSGVFLGEPVSPLRWIGTAIIICGVWLVFRS